MFLLNFCPDLMRERTQETIVSELLVYDIYGGMGDKKPYVEKFIEEYCSALSQKFFPEIVKSAKVFIRYWFWSSLPFQLSRGSWKFTTWKNDSRTWISSSKRRTKIWINRNLSTWILHYRNTPCSWWLVLLSVANIFLLASKYAILTNIQTINLKNSLVLKIVEAVCNIP